MIDSVRTHFFVIVILVVSLFTACSYENQEKQITIAVLGSGYSRFFKSGIEKGYEEALKEYENSGFDIKIDFYDDRDDYEYSSKLISSIVKDENVVAIVGSAKQNICENQAYQANKAGKIFLIPHRFDYENISDSVGNKTFYLNYSCEDIGKIMNDIVEKDVGEKWVVCYSDDEISKNEIKTLKKNDDVFDFVKINALEIDFEGIVKRWKSLDIDGAVFLPYDNMNYEIFYKLRKEMPEISIVSDARLDNDDELKKHRAEFENVYIVDNFNIEEDKENKYSGFTDTFEIQGRNTVRMIIDTAIENNTVEPEKIAEILHNCGYKGVLENFKFDKKGFAVWDCFSYGRFGKTDFEEFVIENK